MLSSISSITTSIDIKDQFSFVDTLGSLVGNRDFGLSYQKYRDGKESGTGGNVNTYIWESLESIGNDIGRKIHSNIKEYINLVSDVDTCKVKSLQSMFNVYGEHYDLIDNVERYPLELRNLIDIFSIDKKYLLKNDYINDDFRRDLEEENVIVSSNHPDVPELYDVQFKDDQYARYMGGIFKTLLSDFLNLSYNDTNETVIKNTLTRDELDGLMLSASNSYEDSISQFKLANNIPVSFNESKIVDDIDNGDDFLENYSGVERQLLEMEISKRAATFQVLYNVTGQNILNQHQQSVEQKTRYSYYRRAKVLEYYRFINNAFSTGSDISNSNRYSFDNSYIEFGRKTDDTADNNILIWNAKTRTYDINEQLLDDTVEILVNITQYIRTLRERLKRQTRKNYMKGTMNLLVYVINQYMVDYAKTQSSIFKNLAGTQLSGLCEKLQSHSSENVKVIEYVDETEYSNIETDVDSKSLNGNSTNPRYWGGFYQTSNQFTEDELQKFYLTDLQLSSDSHISDAYQLLDIIFNLGASTSHIDKQTGEFTAKMSDINNRYSLDVQNERDELETNWNGFVSQLSVLGDDYQYPDGTIQNQISSLEYMVEEKLSSQLLSSVSVVYDKYIGDTLVISSNMGILIKNYEILTSDTYGVYFQNYLESHYGIYDKIQDVKEFAVINGDQNIRFWDLSGTVIGLSNSLSQLSTNFLNTISNLTASYNYVSTYSESLEESIEDAIEFTESCLKTTPTDNTLKTTKENLANIKVSLNISTDVYQNIRTNEKYLQYFGDTAYNYNEYTFRQLGVMMEYINQTDLSNKTKIAGDIENLITEYSDINTAFGDLETEAATELVDYVPTGLTLEEQIEHLKQMLLENIQSNINAADDELNAIMTTLRGYSTVIKNEIAWELSNVSRLSDAVDDRLYQLNPLNYDEYVNAKAQFDMYNGINADSDLYFNPKNAAHPSRQYHPYLRNFIMKDRLTNMIQNVINAYTVDELDEDRIQNNITKYIGEFGQQLNIWKNDAIDYTGYSSLYESSNNSSRKTGTVHEGQHYDGLFHPAAVRMMLELKKDGCIRSLLSALEGDYDEFFTKFYGPLGMTTEDINLEIELLSSFYDNISGVVSPHQESEVFDIYRYGLDAFNNSYSLLKQYNTPNQTYQLKRNTPGRLWLKKYGYPFSYPAFLSSNLMSSFVGIDNNYVIFKNTILGELSGGPGKFYDFEFSNDREFVALVTENNTVSGYQSYDSANVFISKVQLSGSHPYIEDNDVFKHEKMEYCLNDRYAVDFQTISCMTLTDVMMKTAYEVYSSPMSVVFDSSEIEGKISDISSMTIRQILEIQEVSSVITADSETRYLEGASDGEWYTLIGCIPNNSKFYTAYVKKHISYSTDTSMISSNLLNSLPVALVDYGKQKTAYTTIQLPRNPTGDNVIASMCDDNTVAFATLIHSPLSEDDGTLRTYTAEKGTLSSSNSKDDSSHDVYTSDIFVRKCAIREQSLEYISQASFNTNADTSYIPMYPGNDNTTELNAKPISSDGYFPLELLGKSRNIDDMIASVNPNADPYFTIDDIKENYLFGRVYEDYTSALDKTLKIVGNPRICTNPADSSVSKQGNDFEWKIILSNLFGDTTERYNADDYKKLKVLMYNQDNYGKNPYLFADLSSFTGEQGEISANYNNILSNFEEELDINTDVIGTYDNKRINSLENNSIYNISCITLHFNTSTTKLSIKFSTISSEYVDNTYIDKDKIKVCLINDKDLSMFKYYHYMDAYGIYISADASEDGTEISNWYYKDGSKITEGSEQYKEYLRNIDFSSKDHLSDMVILSGYERAIFKYDEEVKYGLDDDVTIMPTINLIYPKTAGSYLYERGSLMNQNTKEDTTNIFQENELFFVDIPNAQEILNSIGRIKIDLNVSDADMFILNEEAFLDNRPRYSTEDPMILSCASLVEVSAIPSAISVNSGPVNVEMDVFINNMSALSGSDGRHYSFCPLCTEEGSSLQSRIVDVSNYPIDIGRFLKIHVNYKKETENNITLYFNYLNYLNTPYVKQIDGRTYIDIIDGTYLKLNSGENGRMDIVLQFRYFEGQKLVGLKNVRVLSYQIYNISDDKPKFIIKEIYRIQKDSDIMNAAYSVFIEGTDTICESSTQEFTNTIRWKSDTTLNKIVFDVIYDSSIIEFNGGDDSRFEVLGPSTFTVTVTDFTYNFIDIPFRFKDGVERYTSQVQLDDVKVYPTDVNHRLVLESVRDGNIIVE